MTDPVESIEPIALVERSYRQPLREATHSALQVSSTVFCLFERRGDAGANKIDTRRRCRGGKHE